MTYATPKTIIKTNRELTGRDPQPGYEWDAGAFHARPGRPGGRITVRMVDDGWQVMEVTFPLNTSEKKVKILKLLPLGEQYEREAKQFALEVFEQQYRQA